MIRAALLLLLAAGCAAVPGPGAAIDGTRWQVTAINGRAVPRSDSYRIEFTDGRIGGRLGCNSFGGDHRWQGATLLVGPVAATKMACPDPAMTFEGWGFSVLGEPLGLAWGDAGGRLTLSSAKGSIALARAP